MTAQAVKTAPDSPPAKPFLKWAGGKGKLLPELLARVPSRYSRYFEPFVGGGALFFALQPAQATLTDINPDLVNAYTVVRSHVEELIEALSQHVYEKDYFYQVRDADRSPAYADWSPVEKAARLIYLNRTCFNGLYRVNSKGFFNVPFGSYKNPVICNEAVLRSCSAALSKAKVKEQSFEKVVGQAKEGDFVYFDPPYAPLTETANFTSYAKEGFGREAQEKLRDVCLELTRKKVKFLLSNSYADSVLGLYQNHGFSIDIVEAPRAINSKATKRGKIREVLVRNYQA